MSGPGVPGLLALLTACGAHVAAQGDTLALTGKRPPAPLLEDLKARKLEVLAYLQDPAGLLPLPDPYLTKTAPVEVRSGEVVGSCDNLAIPAPDVVATRHNLPGPVREVVQSRDNLPARPDWAQIAAQAGRCGSCAHAQDAPEWGALMVSCGRDHDAWWPLSAPFALHVGALCGAYLQPGESVGQGYRARDAVRPWGRA